MTMDNWNSSEWIQVLNHLIQLHLKFLVTLQAGQNDAAIQMRYEFTLPAGSVSRGRVYFAMPG